MTGEGEGRRLGLIQVHVAVLIAGGSGLFAKVVSEGAAVITAGRTVFGTVALLLFALLTRSSLRAGGTRDSAILLFTGGILAAHWFTFFHSIQVSTVAIGLLAFAAFPLFTTFLEPFFFDERLHRRDILAAILVTAGLITVAPRADLSDHATRGILWGLLSALLYAGLSLITRKYRSRCSPVSITFHQQLGAALCSVPFVLGRVPEISPSDWGALLLLGIVFTALGQGLVVASLRHLRARTVSVLFGLEPLYGILLAWLLLGESLTLRIAVGGALICGAVGLASLLDAPDPS